jgi:glycogen(starch) synthase
MAATILHLVHKFVPAIGGTAQRMSAVLSGSRHRHVVCTLVEWGEQKFVDQATPEHQVHRDIAIYRLKYPKPWLMTPVGSGLQAEIRFSSAIRRVIGGHRIDLVNAHSPLVLGRVAAHLARGLRKPLVYEYHQLDQKYSTIPRLWIDKNLWKWIRERRILKTSKQVIVQTQMQRDRIGRLFDVPDEKISILPMGVCSNNYSPAGPELLGRTQVVRFGLVGNLSKEWGADGILKFFQENRSPAYELVIAGDGPLREQIQGKGREHENGVTYLGKLPSSRMPELYRSIDFLIVPCPDSATWRENQPTKIFEAMASSLPIIGTDVHGIKSVLGDLGIYYRANDSKSMASAIKRALSLSIKTRLDMGARMRQVAMDNHSWGAIIEGYDEIYDKWCNLEQ